MRFMLYFPHYYISLIDLYNIMILQYNVHETSIHVHVVRKVVELVLIYRFTIFKLLQR